jgi:hypothetical protein
MIGVPDTGGDSYTGGILGNHAIPVKMIADNNPPRLIGTLIFENRDSSP